MPPVDVGPPAAEAIAISAAIKSKLWQANSLYDLAQAGPLDLDLVPRDLRLDELLVPRDPMPLARDLHLAPRDLRLVPRDLDLDELLVPRDLLPMPLARDLRLAPRDELLVPRGLLLDLDLGPALPDVVLGVGDLAGVPAVSPQDNTRAGPERRSEWRLRTENSFYCESK